MTTLKTKLEFRATIDIIGINPFVFVPELLLEKIFEQAGKNKGRIPVKGTINGQPYRQTLVKYSDAWRLYINTTMLKNSPRYVGRQIEVTIQFDSASREIIPPQEFVKALNKDKKATQVFNSLSPSLKKEIIRYLSALKTEKSLEKNIARALNFLKGKERFVGRELQ